MNLFEINFFNSALDVLKESFKFKKYETMHPVLAIILILVFLPVFIASIFVALLLFCTFFFFKALSSPITYLHSLVRKEGQEVKHGTQVVIYWISWPIVFALYTSVSILLVFITIQYAMLSMLCYVWTLGGYKGRLFF